MAVGWVGASWGADRNACSASRGVEHVHQLALLAGGGCRTIISSLVFGHWYLGSCIFFSTLCVFVVFFVVFFFSLELADAF